MDGPNNTVNVQYTALDYEHFHIMPVIVPPSLAADEAYDTAYVIESAHFRGRYLRMDGQGVNKRTSPGGGTVDTQKGIGTFEMFRLVHQPNGSNVYSIGSMHFNNVYLRMDGRDVNSCQSSGGGVVNCQYGRHNFEKFRIG